MKWVFSIVLAMLITLFCVDFTSAQKSLVYAQSSPTDAYESVGDDESGDVSDQKAKKIVACDNFGYVWSFTVKKKKVSGKVDTGSCGVWDVTGTYKKNKITLKATNPNTSNGCCTAFTYTGSFNKKTKVGSGSWTNECSGSGSWSMSKCN